MHANRGLLRAAGAALAVSLACAAPAFAGSAFNTLFHEYQATGGIKACKHTAAQLQAAENQVPPDITQYAPDFPAALQAALETRAHGGCGGAGGAAGAVTSGSGSATTGGATGASAPPTSGIAPGPTPAPIASPAAASPIAQAAAHAGGGGASAPVPLIALAAVMVLLALAAIWWSVTTLRGTESTRMSTAGHTLGEARVRAGGTLREFADWLRLGR